MGTRWASLLGLRYAASGPRTRRIGQRECGVLVRQRPTSSRSIASVRGQTRNRRPRLGLTEIAACAGISIHRELAHGASTDVRHDVMARASRRSG